MRLSCPNCAAIYELSEDRLTPGGSHVQCGDCHTRWFAKPPALTAPAPAPAPEPTAIRAVERPSEDEIIARLETRAAARGPAPGGPASESIAVFTRPQAAPPKAAQAPSAARPAPAPASTPAPAAAPAAPTPLRPRSDRPAPAAAAPAARRRPLHRSGGRLGFTLALGLASAALGLYLGSDGLAARVPSAAPTINAYSAGIDAARDWIETTLAPPREDASPDA